MNDLGVWLRNQDTTGVLWGESAGDHVRLRQEIGGGFGFHVFHQGQHHAAGCFGVGLGVVVPELVADLLGQSVEFVVRQFGQ